MSPDDGRPGEKWVISLRLGFQQCEPIDHRLSNKHRLFAQLSRHHSSEGRQVLQNNKEANKMSDVNVVPWSGPRFPFLDQACCPEDWHKSRNEGSVTLLIFRSVQRKSGHKMQDLIKFFVSFSFLFFRHVNASPFSDKFQQQQGLIPGPTWDHPRESHYKPNFCFCCCLGL